MNFISTTDFRDNFTSKASGTISSQATKEHTYCKFVTPYSAATNQI